MKRGRPSYFTTAKHVYVVHNGSKISYHLAKDEAAALDQAIGPGWRGGKDKPLVVGKIEPEEYLSKENLYQNYFQDKYGNKTREN